MKARIFVTLKPGVLDPQGKAIHHALGALGFAGVNDVRAGKLIELDLADGTSFTVNGLLVVDERKFLQLSEKDVMALFRAGEMSWVYAHLLSLANMTRLVERLSTLRRAEGAAVA